LVEGNAVLGRIVQDSNEDGFSICGGIWRSGNN
jgi:hypothetical protein